MQANPRTSRVLDRARLQHVCPRSRQLKHLVVAHDVELASGWLEARVGRVDARHIAVYLAHFGSDRRRHRDRREVGAPAPQRGDLELTDAQPLEAGEDHDAASLEGLEDAPRSDLDDLRLPVLVVGHDARLRPCVARGPASTSIDRDAEQRHGDAFTGREQHVELARIGHGRDLGRHREQIVGGVSHRGDHDHDVVAALASMHDPIGDGLDALHRPDRGTAVLLHDDGHCTLLFAVVRTPKPKSIRGFGRSRERRAPGAGTRPRSAASLRRLRGRPDGV